MFDRARLYPRAGGGPVYSFLYDGARVDAAADGQYVYVSIDRSLPQAIMMGLLGWFGIDVRRAYAGYRFTDNSRYYVQKTA